MDKNKVKEALKAKLKQEMSMTGTGASVTPGTGEGVATKYAFSKSAPKGIPKGTPKSWKTAPSIPNRKSKAMDYKELWEGEDDLELIKDKVISWSRSKRNVKQDPLEAKWFKEFEDEVTNSATKDEIKAAMNKLYYMGDFDWSTLGLDEVSDHTKVKTNAEELTRVEELLAKAHTDKSYSVMSAYEFRIKALRLLVGLEKKHNTTLPLLKFGMMVGDYLNEYFPGFKGKFGPYNQNWKSVKDHIEQSLTQKEDMNENIETSGFKSGKEYINIKLQKYPKALAKINQLISMIGEDKFTMDVAKWVFDFFNNASFESPINENYARFRNETKTRTKPEQFHNAVKQVKQKVSEINRLFEYMSRLQSELSESEGGLKHKKYTENALQQIKEATKSLFLKSTKLK